MIFLTKKLIRFKYFAFYKNLRLLLEKLPPNKSKKNQYKKGQVTVEYILLAVVLIALFQIAAASLRDNQNLKNFQELPGQIFRNLVENGNWEPDTRTSRTQHPNHYLRYYTPEANE